MRFARDPEKGVPRLGRLASVVGVGRDIGARAAYAALIELAKRVAELPPREAVGDTIVSVDRA